MATSIHGPRQANGPGTAASHSTARATFTASLCAAVRPAHGVTLARQSHLKTVGGRLHPQWAQRNRPSTHRANWLPMQRVNYTRQ